ncbi:MAG: hypothetical protein Q8J84_08345 [Flavobacteriaceae bacterium]|nr:hypothetical protein [Flavobacteriaceae bacterium]
MFDEYYFPNVLTLCGSGRNVGKTYLGCQIIKHFSKENLIIAVKISKFNHQQPEDGAMLLVNQSIGFQIWRQIKATEKDSGRYLNAGANASYYIECDDTHLLEAFLVIYKIYGNSCSIVCESASITKYINPAISIFVESAAYPTEQNKLHFLNQSTLVLKERSIEISIPQLFLSAEKNKWLVSQHSNNISCYV